MPLCANPTLTAPSITTEKINLYDPKDEEVPVLQKGQAPWQEMHIL